MFRVLIGMPDDVARGGPRACEPPFVRELRRMNIEADEEVYVYGDNSTRTNPFKRIVRVLATARRLRRRLLTESYTIVHLNTAFDLKAVLRDAVCVMVCGSAVRSSKTKIFLKLHGSDARLLETRNLALRGLMRFLLKRVDGIGMLSSEERENFRALELSRAKSLSLRTSSKRICTKRFTLQSADEHSAKRADAALHRALDSRKGLLDVVRACALLHREHQPFVLLCLGDGPARTEAERVAAHLGINEHVRFYGYLPEAETDVFYRNSTMLVFPTYHQEGLSMTIFNSIAAGLPVITTRLRAAADYLSEPENCLWVEPRDPAELAAKIIHLLQHPEMCRAMCSNNLALAHTFTAPIVTAEFIKIYSSIAECGLRNAD